jgi:hypothetical protein
MWTMRVLTVGTLLGMLGAVINTDNRSTRVVWILLTTAMGLALMLNLLLLTAAQ